MPDIFISPKDFNEEGDTKASAEDIKTKIEQDVKPKKSGGMLSAFLFYPDHIDFETREKEEKIVLLLRQHPIVNLKWILGTLALLVIPNIVNYFGVFSSLPSNFVFVLTLVWYLITLAYAVEGFLGWYFNVYIVTNKRVIDVDFYNLIDKKVADAEIEKIQDVSYTNFGVARLFFNYGDVFIQTASEISEFDFEAVPNPEKVVKIIDDLK